MTLRPPPRMAGVTKKPSAKTKTISAAPMMPGSVIGTNTDQKMRVRAGAEASRGKQHALVEARMADASGKTANGIRKCVMPTMTPNSLRTSASGSADQPSPAARC